MAARLLLLVVALGCGCRKDRCLGEPPAFELNLQVTGGVDGARIKTLNVVVVVGSRRSERTLDVTGMLVDGATSLAVEVGSVGAGGFVAVVSIEGRDLGGRPIARGQQSFSGTGDACNFFSMALVAPSDGGVDKPALDKAPLPDVGKCVGGSPCTVSGKSGECAKGKARCFEAEPAGVCEQTVQPATETCDGKDSDCDGLADGNDSDACTGENYCKLGTQPACSFGCATAANCTNGNSCDTAAHACKCGGSGPRCSGGFQCDVTSKMCRCGTKKLTCGTNESCETGACVCGTTKSEDGSACAAPQTCLGTAAKSCGVKPDAGTPRTDV